MAAIRPSKRTDDDEFTATFERLELILPVYVCLHHGYARRAGSRGVAAASIRPSLGDNKMRSSGAGETWPGIDLYGSLNAFTETLPKVIELTRGLAFP